MSVNALPDGYHTVTPHLVIADASAALDYYARAFGAVELMRMEGTDGKVMHAEIQIGDSRVMLADEFPEMGAVAPPAESSGSAFSLMVYVDDVDQLFAQALAAGGEALRKVEDQFYGDRTGTLRDPFGHTWTVATHVEDVSDEELRRRAEDWAKAAV
jgi:PhnB protein